MSRRFTWPWGRISPQKRMEEIDRIISKHKASIRIVEAQAREAVRLHGKSIEYLTEQKAEVESFLDDAKRKELLDRAYALEAEGISVLEKLEGAKTMNEMREILSNKEAEFETKNLEEDLQSPTSLDSETLDIFGDLDANMSDIIWEG